MYANLARPYLFILERLEKPSRRIERQRHVLLPSRDTYLIMYTCNLPVLEWEQAQHLVHRSVMQLAAVAFCSYAQKSDWTKKHGQSNNTIKSELRVG